jgi:ArsR family transcriptional regulator
MDLEDWSTRLKVFADATRVRLLALLEQEELTVAELSAITRLAQPRVSTHLARLKEAGLVRDRRAGVSAYYRFDEAQLDPAQRALWHALSNGSDDPLLRQDAERVAAVLAHRASDQNWADSVAGDMERHYSPGRTWEALARTALPLLETGDVLDIASGDGVLAELVAPTPSATSASIPARAWSPPPASACAGCPMWKSARATCMPCRSRTAASTWWC